MTILTLRQGVLSKLVNLFFKVLFCRSHPSAENANLFLLLPIDVCLQHDFKRFILLLLRVMSSIARRQEHNCSEKSVETWTRKRFLVFSSWLIASMCCTCNQYIFYIFEYILRSIIVEWIFGHDKCAASADRIIRHKILQIRNGSANFDNDGITLTLI